MLPLFMQRNNFTESDCSPRTRYFPLICPTRFVLPASKISSARQPFQSGQSVYLYVRRRPKHWEKERCKNSLARFIHAHATSAGVASRFIHCIRLCTCDFMYMCMRACQLITWLRCFSTSSRNEVSRRDVTQNTRNEIRFDEHLRVSNDPHTHTYTYTYVHIHFYSRDVISTLVIPHGEARITEIWLPNAPS